MQDIDGMDMLGYLKLRAWKANREHQTAEPRRCFIDEAWPGLRPT